MTTLETTVNAAVDVALMPVLHAMLNFHAKDTSRYAINGLMVKDEEVEDGYNRIYCATDGRKLVVISHVLDTNSVSLPYPVIIPSEVVKGLKAPKRGRLNQDVQGYTLNMTTDIRGTLSLGANSTIFEAVEGNFPPYKDVIPAYEESDEPIHTLIGLNATFLAQSCKLFESLYKLSGDTDQRGIRVSIRQSNKPILMQAWPFINDVKVNITAVLMPVSLS